MSVIIANKPTRTKDWKNPRTGQMERVITYPDGRREVIPLTPTNVISEVENKQ